MLQISDTERWKCKDGKRSIASSYVCDDLIHCGDGSDERDETCAAWNCSQNMWKCKNNKCIKASKVCDTGMKSRWHYDCRDKSDEEPKMCRQHNCSEGMWKCRDGLRCIKLSEVCDWPTDCQDKSDKHICKDWTCLKGYWKCKDHRMCISNELVCDGNADCRDDSDESVEICEEFNRPKRKYYYIM